MNFHEVFFLMTFKYFVEIYCLCTKVCNEECIDHAIYKKAIVTRWYKTNTRKHKHFRN